MRRFLNILIILFTTFTFFSCSNLIGAEADDDSFFENRTSSMEYFIQGTVTQEDIFGVASRTAFPAQPGGPFFYRITAKCEEETITSEKNSTDSNFTLKIPHAGNWIVSAEGFQDTARTNLILKTSENKILQISDAAPMGYANLVLKPYVSENGTGKINLSITIPTAVSTVAVNCISDNNKDSFTGVNVGISGSTVTIGDDTNNIKSGNYTVEISFTGTVSGVADVLLYHVTEVINVYDNLTTNTWVKHGDEPYIKDDGTFEITDAMIQDFMFSTVYVGGEGKDDANTGTFLSPVATLTKAFSIPNARNFYITGEVTAGSDFTVNQNGFLRKHPNAATAKISVTHTNSSLILVNASKTFEISNVTITGPGSSFPRSQAGIVNNGVLTLNNCVISEFYRSSESGQNGGAIYNSAGTLTINGGKISNCGAFNGGAVCNLATCNINGVEFSQNKATGMGGGAISNSSTGKVFISGYGTTNTLFIKNESTADAKMIADHDNGGGAILNAGELELENCQFYENSVRFGVGGAIYNSGNASSTNIGKTDNSGASLVVIGKTRQPNYVTASDSTGNSKGGAIYNEGKLYMYKGTCIGDTGVRDVPTSIGSAANYAHEGGGVYNAGTFKIAGGEIKGNLANGIGSGIYCASGSTVSFNGGLITYNSTYTTPSPAAYAVSGSGIYVAGNLEMSGNATVADNNDIYLVTSKTIKLQNALTATGTAATITPQYYNLDASGAAVDPIQLLEESSTGLIAGNYSKFAVKSKDSNPAIEWYVTAKGKLNSKAPGDVLFATLNGVVPTDTSKVYVMDTKEEFETLAGWVNNGNTLEGVNFKLNTNITYTSPVAPIGRYDNYYSANHLNDKAFSGKFDGNNKSITVANYNIANARSNEAIGLFAYTKNAEVKNLTLEGSITISEDHLIGALIGYAENSLIENITNKCTITTEEGLVVGIVGVLGDDSVIFKCENHGALFGRIRVGGIVGDSYGNIHDVVNMGDITITSDSYDRMDSCYAGGIVAMTYECKHNNREYASDYIYNCKNTGTIKTAEGRAVWAIAGIVGFCQSKLVYNCVNEGAVENNGPSDYVGYYVGGIIGQSNSFCKLILNCCNTGTIKSIPKYNVGGISGNSGESTIAIAGNTGTLSSGEPKNVGAICGWPDGVNFRNCTWLSSTGNLYGQIATELDTMGYGSQNNCFDVSSAMDVSSGLNTAKRDYYIPPEIGSTITIPDNFELKTWTLSDGKPTLDISW